MKAQNHLIYLLSIVCSLYMCNDIIAQKKPNVVLIISDDAGYADFGFQGSNTIKTPELDKLAKQGVKCTQAYVTAAVCGPSRAGILTGKYQQKFGFEENNVPGYMSTSCLPDDEMGLPLDQKTIGDFMKELGYTTGYFGKWHQGNADRFHPTKRGFDNFYGFRGGARSYYPFNKNNPNQRSEDKLESGFKKYAEAKTYLTDALADEAVSFIEKNKDAPFFLVLAFNAVHTPMEPDKKDLDKFPELQGNRKKMAALMLSMDRACGHIIKTISKLNLDENTLLIFTNDNGGPSDTNASLNTPLSGSKANHLEGGIRVPFLMRWKGVIPEGSTYDYPISTLDILPTSYAAGRGDTSVLKGIDGLDIVPYVLKKNKARPHQTLYWKKENRGAIRDGDWKFLRFPDRPAELYNLKTDISETTNLAIKYPEKVKELYKMLFKWELKLARPKWQLKRKYEGDAMKRMDKYH